MAQERVLIGGQSVLMDTATGELVVKVSGVTLDADIDIGDVNPLNVAGEKVNPSTSELQATGNAYLAPYSTGGAGTANITGTSAALGSQACRSVTMTANPANRGTLWIAIGATAVIGSGTPLPPGQWLNTSILNLSMVNAIAETPGDDLCYQWVN